jgi:chromosome partitioning protein
MKTIALVTQKGGAGKTTLATALAVAAIETGEHVVALDLDPQGSLAAWGDDRDRDAPAVDKLDDERLARLPEILEGLARAGMTLVVLDCPGIANTATNAAIAAADLCLLPTRPTRLDIRASRPTVQALVGLKRPFAFVLNQCPPGQRNARATEAAEGLHMMGVLAEPFMATRADYQDAVASGLGVTEYAPHGKAADEVRQLWAWVRKQLDDKNKKGNA